MSQLTSAAAADQFRLAFFQNVIVEEQKRNAQTQQKQRSCYHRYQFFSLLPHGQSEWICSRCDHVIQRHVPSVQRRVPLR